MPRGRIVWYECMSADPTRTLAFYQSLFGWTSTSSPGGVAGYRMLSNGGVGFGGMTQRPADAVAAGTPPHWLMYVGVPGVDDAMAQALQLGAKQVFPPTDLPGMGRFAVLADPQGATFALFTAVEPAGDPATPPLVGSVVWNEFAANDHVAAFAFYRTMFAWETREAIDMGPHGIYQLWGRPGNAIDLGGFYNKTADMPVPAWCFYIKVEDLDVSFGRAKALGATAMLDPMNVPQDNRIAVLRDPGGAVFGMTWRKAGT